MGAGIQHKGKYGSGGWLAAPEPVNGPGAHFVD